MGWLKIYLISQTEELEWSASGIQMDLACRLELGERRLVNSLTTVTIPLDDSVIFVRLLNCADFAGQPSKIAQPRDAIPGRQFLVSVRWIDERWRFGAVPVSGCARIGQRRLRSST
jgi:hypothetical protein